jgi:hypothetical protein
MSEVCGNCKFHDPIPEDLSQVGCRGLPPNVVLVPARVGQTMDMQFHMKRPAMPRNERACALWKPIILLAVAANGE